MAGTQRKDAWTAAASPLDSLLRISSQLAGQVEIRAALRSVKAEVENILPVDHLDVCLIDDAAVWNTSYEVGIRTRWSLRRTLVEISPVRSILLSETDFMLTDNAMEDPRYTYPGALSQPIFRHQLRSRVNVAMKVLGRTIGALNCSSRQAGIYDKDTLERVRHVADVLAPYCYSLRAAEKAKQAAIVRAETHAREEGLRQGALELTRALEQERQRIGMDLHDQTLADLTHIVRDLERSEAKPDSGAVLDRLQNCIQDLRRIIDMAVPTLLDLFGFAHALRIHLERAVGEESPVVISVVDATGGAVDDVDKTIRIALFRIAQEAINNAARHSRASRISVHVGKTDIGLVLTIVDDGIGIPDRDGSTPAGKATGGLAHMRTRARLIAAEFQVTTDNGTRVDVWLPGRPGCTAGAAALTEVESSG
ncbi:ATP-binding protein [Fodinicurvata sp. EGI_FJ10296]|uniref:GAF domain-containing sensor histidine kinase n=1 Tax=Fodinicurvata sp. EGI_FJ10296 TaxID=3231908 RepID=UPI00345659F8